MSSIYFGIKNLVLLRQGESARLFYTLTEHAQGRLILFNPLCDLCELCERLDFFAQPVLADIGKDHAGRSASFSKGADASRGERMGFWMGKSTAASGSSHRMHRSYSGV